MVDRKRVGSVNVEGGKNSDKTVYSAKTMNNDDDDDEYR